MPPKSRVYFKNIAEEPMEFVREIFAKKYRDEQIVEALGKEPVVCRGKCNIISLISLMSLKNNIYDYYSIVLSIKLSSSLTFTII